MDMNMSRLQDLCRGLIFRIGMNFLQFGSGLKGERLPHEAVSLFARSGPSYLVMRFSLMRAFLPVRLRR